ncbi:patatin-like phospholipase family protein [bacterium]|nr:patatin-like phospholipase family protein [bacterium]
MVGLCISGGGAKIGFAIGILETLESKGIKPEIVYGISSGSLCTAALCYGSVDFIKNQLLEIRKKEEVLKPQLFKVLTTQIMGLGKADGIYSMNRMRKKLDQLPEDKPLMKGVVGYVDLKSGGITYVSSLDVGKEGFLDAVQASCSIPLAMQTLRLDDEVRVDGGVRDMLPLKQLIDDPIKVNEVHVVSLNPITPSEKDTDKKILPVALRTIDLILNEVLQNDLKIAKIYNMLLEKGYEELIPGKRPIKFFEYVPTQYICDSIDFNKENIQKGIDHGLEIANEVLKNYP